MPKQTKQVTPAYLAELETALAGIAPETRNGILHGVREELHGLSEADAVLRIQELGDPEFIASEARAQAASFEEYASQASREPRWFSVVAALLIMLGGIVIPILGSVAGLVMMWFSTTWSRKEKWIATLIPVAVALLAALLGGALSLWQAQQTQPGGLSPNPLVPVPFDLLMSGIALVLITQFAVGVWLLVRGRAGITDR